MATRYFMTYEAIRQEETSTGTIKMIRKEIGDMTFRIARKCNVSVNYPRWSIQGKKEQLLERMRLSMNGMRVNNTAASASAIASMGGYGCKKYNVPGGDAEEFKADGIGTFVSVIQAFEDTEILTVKACWDAPTDVDGIIIPAGMCLYVKAESVTISSGCGVIYYEMAS